MAGHVVVIASGETERRALPHLTDRLRGSGTEVVDIRIPPRQRPALDPQSVERLVKAAWFGNWPRPDKFVVLVDADRDAPARRIDPLREALSKRLEGIDASVLFAYARQHLEAWYFADSRNLESYLGRNLGRADTARPDEIDSPKEHLKNLLGDRVYTAAVSERIARTLDVETIRARSPSFAGFLDAALNGDQPKESAVSANVASSATAAAAAPRGRR